MIYLLVAVVVLFCLICNPVGIWFLLWWNHGFPNLLNEWNPWNISLIICWALNVLGGYGYKESR